MRVRLALVVFLTGCSLAVAQEPHPHPDAKISPVTPQNAVVKWNNVALQAVRESRLGPAMVARALAVVHTCIYDAWAAYDTTAVGTQLGSTLRQPPRTRTLENKQKAISYASFRALVDLFPAYRYELFEPAMQELGYDYDDVSTDTTTPQGVGNVACGAVLKFRHHDGANQLGDLTPGRAPYSDWTGTAALNAPSALPVSLNKVSAPDHWQPLSYPNKFGITTSQTFSGAQWFKVKPFALASGDQFRAVAAGLGPAKFGSAEFRRQNLELVQLSAALTDREKMISEYWSDGPNSELPPGHWDLFAQFVSKRDSHTIDEDARLFFALTNAIFDASIAAWDAKRAFDSVRPATSIPYLFAGKKIRSWAGPGKGTQDMDGSEWMPYQPRTFPTPPFPEFISGHSTFSSAGAEILRLWTRSDRFDNSVLLVAGSSKLEPGITPQKDIILYWPTFSSAAAEAGFSRRLGGIHFRAADLAGRSVGRLVAQQAWQKAQQLWDGTYRGPESSLRKEKR